MVQKIGATMLMTRDEIKSAALRLEPAEREALAEELLLSISPTEADAIDAACLKEAYRREAASQVDNSRLKTVEEVIERLRRKAPV